MAVEHIFERSRGREFITGLRVSGSDRWESVRGGSVIIAAGLFALTIQCQTPRGEVTLPQPTPTARPTEIPTQPPVAVLPTATPASEAIAPTPIFSSTPESPMFPVGRSITDADMNPTLGRILRDRDLDRVAVRVGGAAKIDMVLEDWGEDGISGSVISEIGVRVRSGPDAQDDNMLITHYIPWLTLGKKVSARYIFRRDNGERWLINFFDYDAEQFFALEPKPNTRNRLVFFAQQALGEELIRLDQTDKQPDYLGIPKG